MPKPYSNNDNKNKFPRLSRAPEELASVMVGRMGLVDHAVALGKETIDKEASGTYLPNEQLFARRVTQADEILERPQS